ncbi:ABC transporter permease [Spiroplasma endosymbiont of Stenodema calcarata]|uniref:ABC transporter permease n=1 Tax=Spiroplasma endosymbiont of Stenodema calcarata TaxID=3139328 RepID=UPI003CCAEDC8
MKSNDIKILKIKPIKQDILYNKHSDYQEASLITKSHFLGDENRHFFNNDIFVAKAFMQPHQPEYKQSSWSGESRELTLNLDNPDALKVLHNQAEKLEQEKTNFYQRLDKIKTTFDEKGIPHSDDYLQEPPLMTKKVDLASFNNNRGDRVTTNDRLEDKRAALKVQARAVAQKIVQKNQQELSKTTEEVIKKDNISKPRSILDIHFPKKTLVNSTPKKDIIVTQSYNNKASTKQDSGQVNPQPTFTSKINSLKQEEKQQRSNDLESLGKNQESWDVKLDRSVPCDGQNCDTTDAMEWDITKRPNLGPDHTTNKNYYQGQINKQLEPKPVAVPLKKSIEIEEPRTIQIEEPVGSYWINNFYTSLFETPGPMADMSKAAGNVGIKKGQEKRQKQGMNKVDSVKEETKSNILQPTTFLSNNYKIQQLPNGRQRIYKINNIIMWRSPIILIARLMAIIGLIILCSTFLIFSNWINNSSLDIYNFITITFGKFDFIQSNQNYLLVNRLFMIVLISIYAIVIILPLCSISNFKIQLYFFLPLSLIFLGSLMAIALYGYLYNNNNFVLKNNIMHIISYSFLIIANLLMLIGFFYLKHKNKNIVKLGN